MDKLTKKQAQLFKDIEIVMSLNHFDFNRILDHPKRERTQRLIRSFEEMVRLSIITNHAFIDVHLSYVISLYYIGEPKRKTRRKLIFEEKILDKLYLIRKLEIADEIYKFPSDVKSTIYILNNLRNLMAHQLFPEKRAKHKLVYKGLNIYTIQGYKKLHADVLNIVVRYFLTIMF